MFNETLRYDDLRIVDADIYEQMGYGGNTPDEDVLVEIDSVIARIKDILRPRYCYFVSKGELDTAAGTLHAMGNSFDVGRIISRQLRGSAAFAFFVATAGEEFEQFQQRLGKENDMVKVFVADSIGSIIAEKAADLMEESLQKCIDGYGWHHTNRFSPGYCGWHVSQQQMLFPMFGTDRPCGVRLTESSLMMPIKSVSGVIGLGPEVRKLEYSCGLCDFKDCYKRKTRRPTDKQQSNGR